MTRFMTPAVLASCYLTDTRAPASLPLPSVFRGHSVVHYEPPSSDGAFTTSRCVNGFVHAFRMAYNHHLPLRLSPDNVGLTILQAVGKFIHDNADALRKTLVAHDGKKDIVVNVPPEWETGAGPNWASVLDVIRDNITADVKSPTLVEAFTPAYSTTTPASVTAATVCLMSSMQAYFNYGMTTSCGIGEVYMDGCVEDWEALRKSVHSLTGIAGLEALQLWLARVDKVLAELVQTAKGTPTPWFWGHAYSEFEQDGSGAGTYLSGWFLDFFNMRDSKVSINSLPSGVVDVPFLWQRLDGSVTKYKLLAGCWTACVDKTTLAARAASPQWAVLHSDGAPVPQPWSFNLMNDSTP
jgi:hypothetical protein